MLACVSLQAGSADGDSMELLDAWQGAQGGASLPSSSVAAKGAAWAGAAFWKSKAPGVQGLKAARAAPAKPRALA